MLGVRRGDGDGDLEAALKDEEGAGKDQTVEGAAAV